jgi:hypothetical protein
MPSSASATVERWNRRLHFYLGLFFLLFVWLFSLTGLLLNHGRWQMAQAANERREARSEMAIRPLDGATDLERAREVMRQLHLTGEIEWPSTPQQAGRLEFGVSRPTEAAHVRIDLTQNRVFLQHFENSRLAAVRIFHTFSGSRVNASGTQRDWLLTTIWVLSMDALAGALIVMVLGSYYMWYRLKAKRRLGAVALAAGLLSCGIFLTGVL